MTRAERSALGRTLASLRKSYGAGSGRPKVLRQCPGCSLRMGARELRTHRCAKRPVKTLAYTVILESGRRNFGAYVPDLPGCVATGKTLEEVKVLIREAIALHLEGMQEDGDPIPEPTCAAAVVEVAVPPTPARGMAPRAPRS